MVTPTVVCKQIMLDTGITIDRRVTQISFFFLIVTCAFLSFSSTAAAQENMEVEIGRKTLDHDRNLASRWTRVIVDPAVTGPHRITVAWDGDADLRFSIFQVLAAAAPGNTLRIANVNSSSPAQWTGSLNASEDYYLGVWSASGSATFTATLEPDVQTPSPPVIVAQPTDQTVTEGDSATFEVNAIGSGNLSFQWLAEGIAIAGAIDSSLMLSEVALGDSGTTYSVQITDDNGSIVSSAATLTVEVAPVVLEITAQPTDQTVAEGSNATFSVTAIGSGDLSFQWLANGAEIAGATASTLSLTSVTAGLSGTAYSVQVFDEIGLINSVEAILTVDEIAQPPVTIVTVGQGTLDANRVLGPSWTRIDFDSLASATHAVTVSWSGDADVRFKIFTADGTAIDRTMSGLSPAVWYGELEPNTAYYIAAWSRDGVADYTVSIEATVPVSIDRQPTDLTVTAGSDAHFLIEASGSGALNYQWFAGGTLLTGETSASLTVVATSLDDSGTEYNVEVSNGTDTLTSESATLIVIEPTAASIYSEEADESAWILDGPAPTLDFNGISDSDGWGRTLLRIGDLLLVGGDFEGIRSARDEPVVNRPWLAAIDAVSGQPVSTFQVPIQVDSVVRALALSPDGEQVYVGGDFGLLVLDAVTGALASDVSITKGVEAGRVFDIEMTDIHVYVGGDFSQVAGSTRSNIARLFLDGTVDDAWQPDVQGGLESGREAPVQTVTISPLGDALYIGGTFLSVDGVAVPTSNLSSMVSLLSVETAEGAAVRPERFTPVVDNEKRVRVRDVHVTENYVIVAWGGPNHLTFHLHDGTLLHQYDSTGDIQVLEVIGDILFVGHHGQFFGSLTNPLPPDAVKSLDPEIIDPFKFHSLSLRDPGFPLVQAWRIKGAYGVWGIAVGEDAIWISGQIRKAGANDRAVDGLARFPAIIQ